MDTEVLECGLLTTAKRRVILILEMISVLTKVVLYFNST